MAVRRLALVAFLMMTAIGPTPGLAPLPFPRPGSKADMKAMQGQWEATTCRYWRDNRKVGQPLQVDCPHMSVVVSGDRLTLSQFGEPIEEATFWLDGSRSPKQIDALVQLPPGAKQGVRSSARWSGVYKLEGDTLTISDADVMEAARPDDFSGDRPWHRLIVLKRAKPRP
jgi:uncharacterized protein (TIGR03067 family)